MRLIRPVLLAALLGAAPSARAGVGRAVEIALPGEAATVRTIPAPAVTLQLTPVAGLAAPGLSPALASPLAAALAAPAPLAPSALTAKPVTPAAAVLSAPAAPAAPGAPVDTVGALRRTGAALTQSAPASAEAGQSISALFDGGAAGSGASAPAGAVDAGPAPSRAPRLAPSAPRPARPMPEGVKRAFQNSAVLGGGLAAIGAGLFAWTQSLAGAPTPAQFALLAAPLLLVPFHFALVSGFWAGRYYAYPKLSPAAKSAFETSWRALAVAYPVAALGLMAAWLQVVGHSPAILALMGLPALVALGEVTHHFIYRVVPERAQDKGKPLSDWRSRAGGNIGQQLQRMRRKP